MYNPQTNRHSFTVFRRGTGPRRRVKIVSCCHPSHPFRRRTGYFAWISPAGSWFQWRRSVTDTKANSCPITAAIMYPDRMIYSPYLATFECAPTEMWYATATVAFTPDPATFETFGGSGGGRSSGWWELIVDFSTPNPTQRGAVRCRLRPTPWRCLRNGIVVRSIGSLQLSACGFLRVVISFSAVYIIYISLYLVCVPSSLCSY